MTETSITTLIQGLKQGDHGAAEKLWVRYFDKLVAVARKKLRSMPRRAYDEEDVVVSVFDSLCRGAERGNFEKLSDREDLWALLLAITRQKTVDRIRYEKRIKRGGGKVRGESVFGNSPGDDTAAWGIDQLVDDEPTPESVVLLNEQYVRLLEQLPDERMHRIVALRMEGHTVKSIAEEFGYTTRWAERKLELIRKTWLRDLQNQEQAKRQKTNSR